MHQKVLETEAAIQAAFIELLQTKSFEKISVSDITKLAHINRGTFYLHYVDKYALLDHYENRLIDQIQDYFTHDFEGTMTYQSVKENGVYTYPVVQKTVGFIHQEFALWQALLGLNGDPRFELKLKRIMKQAISNGLDRVKGDISVTRYIPEAYAWELIISGMFTIIKTWLQEAVPQSPEQIADIMMKTRFLSPYDLLGIKD
ncbi:TetR/AcrR family transcriptional regulator [Lacticaseibacillus porcinae]|uniref:TetR/AcrR family transcriptional regulator n=1 Tax=Lacticaseibacillus porcinae TaxID=1123687 RepID=UPI000F794C43|nr:TetR/AcrR family transcriptional regulator C-terminal domain-containing protein [Lacticaseibacillus porcinae]